MSSSHAHGARLNKWIRRIYGGRSAALAAAFLLALALAGTAMAQSATVMTDQSDYAPGTIVTITGSGWQPGETVTLRFVESPLIDTHHDLTAVADANGDIFNNQFSPDAHDANITFTLTASGSVSGFQAQTTFTDTTHIQNNGASVGVQSPAAVVPGGTATFTVQVTFNGNASSGSTGCTVALSITTTLPTGASASFSPSSLTGTSSSTLSATLTISTTGATPAGATPFTVQAQGTGGATNDCTSADTQSGTGSLVVSSPTVRRKGQTIVATLLPTDRHILAALQ